MATEQKTPTSKLPSQVIAEARRCGQFKLENVIRAQCPCGREFQVGEVEGVPAILHAEPICKEFTDLDLADFLHHVNVHNGEHN